MSREVQQRELAQIDRELLIILEKERKQKIYNREDKKKKQRVQATLILGEQ